MTSTDDHNLYQSFFRDPVTGYIREFYAASEDTAVMMARRYQPHRLGGRMISCISGEVVAISQEDQDRITARAKILAALFGSEHL